VPRVWSKCSAVGHSAPTHDGSNKSVLFCSQLLFSVVPFTCRYPLKTMSIVALELKYQQLFAVLTFLWIRFLLYIKMVQWALTTHTLRISTYFYLSFKIFTYLKHICSWLSLFTQFHDRSFEEQKFISRSSYNPVTTSRNNFVGPRHYCVFLCHNAKTARFVNLP